VLVIDASVAVKWFVAEADSPAARAVGARADLAAPEWLVLEVANALERHRRQGLLTVRECRAAPKYLSRVMRLHPALPLVEAAQGLAASHALTVYDAVYLALGHRLGALVVTADGVLGRAPGARLLTDIPGVV
jgi:predicted nucleic acid-binding protein